jgi:hypothetical protein
MISRQHSYLSARLHRFVIDRSYAVACFEPDFACGSMVHDHVCFPCLRLEAQTWKTKKKGTYRSAEG